MSDDTNTPAQPAFVAVPNAAETPPAAGETTTDPVTAAGAPTAGEPPAETVPEEPAAQTPPAKGKTRAKRTQATVTTTDPVTAVVTTTDVVGEVILDALPESATLAAPYAYYDDDGALRSWSAGQVLVDPDEIAMLIDRGALFTAE